jgi:addiction module HigA family antidote
MTNKLKPIHPGEVLEQDFLEPNKLTQYRAAKDMGVPARRINEIIHGTRAISADTALRLARYFGTSAQFWMNLQGHYDLECERDSIAKVIERDVRVFA